MKEALVLFMLALLILPLLLAVRTLRRLPPPGPSEGEDGVSPAASPDED
jgi:hypothetical protein